MLGVIASVSDLHIRSGSVMSLNRRPRPASRTPRCLSYPASPPLNSLAPHPLPLSLSPLTLPPLPLPRPCASSSSPPNASSAPPSLNLNPSFPLPLPFFLLTSSFHQPYFHCPSGFFFPFFTYGLPIFIVLSSPLQSLFFSPRSVVIFSRALRAFFISFPLLPCYPELLLSFDVLL